MNDKMTHLTSDSNNEYFTLTNNLRWIEIGIPMMQGEDVIVGMTKKKVLQQMSQGSKGTQKWEDVPTVTK